MRGERQWGRLDIQEAVSGGQSGGEDNNEVKDVQSSSRAPSTAENEIKYKMQLHN